jgi:hypothetical protein
MNAAKTMANVSMELVFVREVSMDAIALLTTVDILAIATVMVFVKT